MQCETRTSLRNAQVRRKAIFCVCTLYGTTRKMVARFESPVRIKEFCLCLQCPAKRLFVSFERLLVGL